jgi:hypothetical protein
MASIPPAVRDAIVTAYYPRALSSPDSARSRAQAGYTIASAIAAALVAAGVLGDIESQRTVVQALGLSAIILWMTTAWFYMLAVSVPVRVVEGLRLTEDAFVDTTLRNAKAERNEVDLRQRRARLASFGAVLLTVVAFATALYIPPDGGVPHSVIVWSRTDKQGKLSVKITVDRLQTRDRVETDVLGINSSGLDVLLMRGHAEADTSGRAEVDSDLSVKTHLYSRFVVRTLVRRGQDQLNQDEASIGSE